MVFSEAPSDPCSCETTAVASGGENGGEPTGGALLVDEVDVEFALQFLDDGAADAGGRGP